LYFTVLARRDGDGLAQWEGAKVAVSEAIVAAGGTISHHHGVGTAHLRWLGEETGPLGLALLRAVKATLDPTGVLNPGKLLPPR
jgi:alkyldihydroxyacetonephosphate synthase